MADRPRSHGRLAVSVSRKPRSLMEGSPQVAGAWQARVITLFPEAFPGVLGQSLTGKALQDGLWSLKTYDLRAHGVGKHRDVDDTSAGGGAGMVLRADVMAAALASAGHGCPEDRTAWPIVYLSPRGRRFDQSMAKRMAETQGVTLICGRFEGVDQRVLDAFNVEEISVGDFVLSGGEIAAQAVIDATVRLLPGVLGNAASVEEESFSNGLLEHPQFTKPAEWQGRKIPDVLLSGHHGKINQWRQEQSKRLTQKRRPDLWEEYSNKKNTARPDSGS